MIGKFAKGEVIYHDEVHRIGGSTEQVARYKLGKALAEITQHPPACYSTSRQEDAFFRLLNILDPYAFPEPDAVNGKSTTTFVRTEKRNALNDKDYLYSNQELPSFTRFPGTGI